MGLAESILVIVSTLLGLAVLVGGFAAFRIGKSNALVSGYKETADSWERQARATKSELEEANEKIRQLERSMAQLQGKVNVLEDLATGRTAIQELRKEVADNTQAIIKEIKNGRTG